MLSATVANWEMYQNDAGEYRWRVTDTEGNIMGNAQEGYTAEASCLKNAHRFGYEGEFSSPTDQKWEFYNGTSGDFRWRAYHNNGEVIAAAHKGYKTAEEAMANAVFFGYEEGVSKLVVV